MEEGNGRSELEIHSVMRQDPSVPLRHTCKYLPWSLKAPFGRGLNLRTLEPEKAKRW